MNISIFKDILANVWYWVWRSPFILIGLVTYIITCICVAIINKSVKIGIDAFNELV